LTPPWNGMRVRAPLEPWLRRIHHSLGMRTLELPAQDLPEAMNDGWVQGVASTPELLERAGLSATASRFHTLRILHGWMVLYANRSWLDGLPADLKELVIRLAEQTCQESLARAGERENNLLKAWRAAGHPEPREPESAWRDQARNDLAPLVEPEIENLQTVLQNNTLKARWRTP
ncbi:MAG: hypothetical protein HQM02_11925, partial [Magnetococcales bacterium]|nr:hypothetical protein [Magnetococcales bacterium]